MAVPGSDRSDRSTTTVRVSRLRESQLVVESRSYRRDASWGSQGSHWQETGQIPHVPALPSTVSGFPLLGRFPAISIRSLWPHESTHAYLPLMVNERNYRGPAAVQNGQAMQPDRHRRQEGRRDQGRGYLLLDLVAFFVPVFSSQWLTTFGSSFPTFLPIVVPVNIRSVWLSILVSLFCFFLPIGIPQRPFPL